jgi:hypothetical protein
MRWYGHIYRMSEEKVPNLVLNINVKLNAEEGD